MRPLKIALLCRDYWLESQIHYHEEGGTTRQLAEAVAALGHEVVVLTQSSDVRTLKKSQIGALETWLSPRDLHRGLMAGLRDKAFSKTYAYPKVYSDALSLREFLKRRGPFDVIWAHAESPDGLVASFAAQRGLKLPPVLVQVQSLPCRFEKNEPVFIDKHPLQLAFRRAKRILAPSQMVVNYLDGYTGPGLTAEELHAKVRIVPPNLQSAVFRAAQEPPAAPMLDRVLFLGAINQRKGAPIFLKALPLAETSKRISTYVMIGDFTEYNRRFMRRWEEAKEIMRTQLTGARVEYLGRVSTFEVLRQIALASAIVVPSLFDPFSRGVVESLILGRPVITTDKVGSAPIVQANQCGIVIPAGNPEALARAIDVILDPIVPFVANAQRVGPGLLHEYLSETIAPIIAQHLSEIATSGV